jgi:hypothetical protein
MNRAYVSKAEETDVRELLDELARKLRYRADGKESYFPGFYVDRLWYSVLEGEQDPIPVVGFEIERSVPLNERLRKDILNLAWSRVPVGFIVLPHRRICADPTTRKGSTAQNWYLNRFWGAFQDYRQPFGFYCEVRLLDFDELMETKSLAKARLCENHFEEKRGHD